MGKSSKSTTTSEVPGYVTEAGTELASKSSELLNKPFEAYTDPRVAEFTADQQSAFQKLRDLIAGAPQIGEAAVSNTMNAAAAPAQSIQTERIVDENGKLGAIEDYLNPYRNAVVDPALRKIQEQSDKQAKSIGSMATASKAYGDARHGILEAMLGRDTSLATGETTGSLLKQGYDTAMGQRTSDVNRFKDVDTLNANFEETALNRNMAGNKAAVDIASADQNRLLTQINALLGAGTQQQGNEQSKLDAAYQEFMRKYIGDDQAKIAAAAQAMSGLKGNYSTTKTEEKPDNSLLGGVGSAAGSVLSSPGFWSWMGGGGAAGGAAMGGGGAAAAASGGAGLASLLALI